ncbi:MAG: hypothetical protein H7X92_09190 [Chitinophagales bacterium]|nr:hypothetical protein [Hyphomicrobiales bacterium]
MAEETTFTLAQSLAAQKALRDAAGAEEELFNLAEVVGMASEEIEMLQGQGKSNADIAAMMQTATGNPITAEDIEAFYLSPEERERWGEDDDDEDA